jgi:hypothetical protein
MAKTGRVYVNQSVSFPPALLEAAKKRAQSLGLGFSTYVRKCLEQDIRERKALVFDEIDDVDRLVAEAAPAPVPRRRRS